MQGDESDSDPVRAAAFEITLRCIETNGREAFYTHVFEMASAFEAGQNGWTLTTGLPSPQHGGARAEVQIKRVA